MKRITDPSFRYTPAAATDIRKTFARIKRQQIEQAKRKDAIEAEQAEKLAGHITPKRRTA